MSILFFSVVVYLDIPLFREYYPAMESVSLVVCTGCILLGLLLCKKLPVFNRTEWIFFLLLMYKIISILTTPAFTGRSVAILLFYLALYCILRMLAEELGMLRVTIWSAMAIAALFVIYIFCFLWPGEEFKKRVSFFLPNTSLFAILLATQLSLFVGLLYGYYQQGTKKPSTRFVIAIVTAFVPILLLLAWTNGRAGWIGGGIAILFILYAWHHQFRKWKWLWISLIVVSLSGATFLYKPGSSAGRLLIYKVSFSMLQDNWIWGIGQGQFAVRYNQYQGNYFTTRDLDSKEALLADNTIYAFNEPLQLLIENGIIGMLLLVILAIGCLKHLPRNLDPGKSILSIASAAALLCLVISSMVFYSFHVLPVNILALACFAFFNSSTVKSRTFYYPVPTRVIKASLTILAAAMVVYFFREARFYYAARQAKMLARSGFKSRALALYRGLNEDGIKDGHVLFLYARELYITKQLREATIVLKKAERYYSPPGLYSLLGTVYTEHGQIKKAEIAYKTAVYQEPKKMKSRFELYRFYLDQNDTAKAVYWARSILKMPVKIPSADADRMKTSVNLWMTAQCSKYR